MMDDTIADRPTKQVTFERRPSTDTTPSTMLPGLSRFNALYASIGPTGTSSARQTMGRKFSFPAALHANLLGLAGGAKGSALGGVGSLGGDAGGANGLGLPGDKADLILGRRRFSNVSDAVTRKLSNTIGWRLPAVPVDEVVAQGRVLCGQYIRNRLKRSGYFNRKLGLYRLRSMVGTSSALIVREVFPGLVGAASELERLHPQLYTNVARQASNRPLNTSSWRKGLNGTGAGNAAGALLAAIGHDLCRVEMTWGKVVAMYAIAGGLAVDCVCQGRPEALHGLMEGMAEVLEVDVAEWIANNGGWTALSNQCRFPEEDVTYREYATIVVVCVAVLLMIYFIIRLFFKIGLF